MSIKVTLRRAYADLGDVWFEDQTARLLQRHLQFGQHFRLDVDLLLAARGRAARAARAASMPVADGSALTDHTRSAARQVSAHHTRSANRSSLDAARPSRVRRSPVPRRRAYSTVTLFARFRGLSTSVPRSTAV